MVIINCTGVILQSPAAGSGDVTLQDSGKLHVKIQDILKIYVAVVLPSWIIKQRYATCPNTISYKLGIAEREFLIIVCSYNKLYRCAYVKQCSDRISKKWEDKRCNHLPWILVTAWFLSLKQFLQLQDFFYKKPSSYFLIFDRLWCPPFYENVQNFSFLHFGIKCKLSVKTHIVTTPLHASFVVNFRATWRLIVDLSLVGKRNN